MSGDPNYMEVTVGVGDVEKTVNELASEWTHETTLDVVDVPGAPATRVRLLFRRKIARSS